MWQNVVFVVAALLPAVLLLRYIYRKDKIEKEPVGLLVRLLVGGCLAALVAGTLEYIGQALLSSLLDPNSAVYIATFAFLVVAVAEEGMKLFFLKRMAWRSPAFNYRFDGVVYAVFVSLGFAALENIVYVFSYGLSVALSRAALAVPAHMGFAVFMGAFFGRAKVCQIVGDRRGQQRNIWLGYLLAVFLHGFYDACAMISTPVSMAVFFAFVVVMYIIVIRRIRREANNDRQLF